MPPATRRKHQKNTRPNLKLVVSKPPPPPTTSISRWQEPDPVFFHKSQISIGTRLVNFGRTRHGTIWEVTEIHTWHQSNTGAMRWSQTPTVAKLSDDLVIRRLSSNETRQLPFSSLSYSAIWRLAQV